MLGAPEGFCLHDPFSSLAGQLSLQMPLQLSPVHLKFSGEKAAVFWQLQC